MKKRSLLIIGMGLFLLPISNRALGKEFYQGKTIRFIVGFSAGGGYDTYTRAIARHIRKHITGTPETVVENMVGAGSLLAANHLFAKAEADGLHVGVWNGGMIMQQALGARAVRFDARKFGFIGAPGKGIPTCAIMAFTGLRTLDDVVNSTKTIRMGGARTGTGPDDIPKLMNKLMGTRFQVISG
jgi:tripartite-type tricarboxylate transporter receptor subunit TctC